MSIPVDTIKEIDGNVLEKVEKPKENNDDENIAEPKLNVVIDEGISGGNGGDGNILSNVDSLVVIACGTVEGDVGGGGSVVGDNCGTDRDETPKIVQHGKVEEEETTAIIDTDRRKDDAKPKM